MSTHKICFLQQILQIKKNYIYILGLENAAYLELCGYLICTCTFKFAVQREMQEVF